MEQAHVAGTFMQSFIEKNVGDLHKINFDAIYQREREQWSTASKVRLIDSILRGYDIDSITVFEHSNGRMDCIDGKQRGSTIKEFVEGKFSVPFEDKELGISKQKISFVDLQQAIRDKDHCLHMLAYRFFHYRLQIAVYKSVSLLERLRIFENKNRQQTPGPIQLILCMNFLARAVLDHIRTNIDDDARNIFSSWKHERFDDLKFIMQALIANFGISLDEQPLSLKNQLGIKNIKPALEGISRNVGEHFEKMGYDEELADQFINDALLIELGYADSINLFKRVTSILAKVCNDIGRKITPWHFNHITYVMIQKVRWGFSTTRDYERNRSKLVGWVRNYLDEINRQKANRGDRQERKRETEIMELLDKWPLDDVENGPTFPGVYVAKTERNTLKIGKAEKAIADRYVTYRVSSSDVRAIGVLSFDPNDEDHFKNKFAAFNVKGELFEDVAAIRNAVVKPPV